MTTPCTRETHEATKADKAQWLKLAFVCVQRIKYDDGGADEVVEMRNCGCGSTLCVDVVE